VDALPFGKPGSWLRGNLHTHSTNSDGTKSPREVCAAYRRKGYDFICLSDHFMERYGFPVSDTTPFRTDGFTTLIGAELHTPKTSRGDLWHILAVGLPLDFAPTGARESGARLAARAREAGAYVAAAHPAWYDLTDRDVRALGAVAAIEIANTTCQGLNGRGDSIGYLDRLLRQGGDYHAIATDDAHFKPDRRDFAKNWVMVRSQPGSPAGLLAALHAGRFYSSQGPEIHDVQIVRSRKAVSVAVRTSPVRSVWLTGSGARSARVHSGKDITAAELDPATLEGGYARLTVCDGRGRKAWTNPFLL
jgi:hypothetical protein